MTDLPTRITFVPDRWTGGGPPNVVVSVTVDVLTDSGWMFAATRSFFTTPGRNIKRAIAWLAEERWIDADDADLLADPDPFG